MCPVSRHTAWLEQSADKLGAGDEGPLCLPLDTELLGTLDEMEKAASSDTQLFQKEVATIWNKITSKKIRCPSPQKNQSPYYKSEG